MTLSVTDTSVVLKWKEGTDGNTPIEKYIIQYQKSGISHFHYNYYHFVYYHLPLESLFLSNQNLQGNFICLTISLPFDCQKH